MGCASSTAAIETTKRKLDKKMSMGAFNSKSFIEDGYERKDPNDAEAFSDNTMNFFKKIGKKEAKECMATIMELKGRRERICDMPNYERSFVKMIM